MTFLEFVTDTTVVSPETLATNPKLQCLIANFDQPSPDLDEWLYSIGIGDDISGCFETWTFEDWDTLAFDPTVIKWRGRNILPRLQSLYVTYTARQAVAELVAAGQLQFAI
jgi:hypothetical protein